MRLGDGERKSGGDARPSMLADTLEALVGAVYIDQGFEHAKGFVVELYSPFVAEIDLSRDIKDPKTRLQEALQGRRLSLPDYAIIETHGEQHVQEFVVSCSIASMKIRTEGRGTSRRIAEQRAAALALDALSSHGGGT